MYEWESKPALGYSVERSQELGFDYSELFLLRFFFLWIEEELQMKGYSGVVPDDPKKKNLIFYPVVYSNFLEAHPIYRTKRRLRATFDRLCGSSGKQASILVTSTHNPYPLRKTLVHLQSNTIACFASVYKNIKWLEGVEEHDEKILEFRKPTYV